MVADDPVGSGPARTPRNPISRRRIEVVIARSVASFGLIFAAQALLPVVEQSRGLMPIWNWVVSASVFGGLAASLVAALVNRGVLAVNGYIAVSWFVAMMTWPLAIADTAMLAGDPPWLFYLLTVATAAAAVAWPVWAATAALVVLSASYGVVRILPAGGSDDVGITVLNSIYAILLGGAVLMIITLLRQAAAAVDQAQSTAIDRYSTAVREHATEVERVHVDAIVHDSVLTTFLSAARADTPAAKRLAGQMAENAMGYLRDAATSSPDTTGVVSLQELGRNIKAAASEVPAHFVIRRLPDPEGEIPQAGAEAVYAAAVQAMINSAQHAGSGPEVRRWLAVRGADGGIEVEVGDSGTGFDPAEIPTARIGLRVSILERMANAGGRVQIDSAPGAGAVLRIEWPAVAVGAEETTREDQSLEPSGGVR